MVQQNNGTTLENHQDIEREIMEFYGNLMGEEDNNLNHIDIDAMRKGNQLNMVPREFLICNIYVQEIEKALKGIGDTKAPGIDVYGANFLKLVGISSRRM